MRTTTAWGITNVEIAAKSVRTDATSSIPGTANTGGEMSSRALRKHAGGGGSWKPGRGSMEIIKFNVHAGPVRHMASSSVVPKSFIVIEPGLIPKLSLCSQNEELVF
jgi:hypothetical protein